MVRFLHRMKSNRKAQSKNQKPRRKDFSKKLQNFFKSDYILDFAFLPQENGNLTKVPRKFFRIRRLPATQKRTILPMCNLKDNPEQTAAERPFLFRELC